MFIISITVPHEHSKGLSNRMMVNQECNRLSQTTNPKVCAEGPVTCRQCQTGTINVCLDGTVKVCPQAGCIQAHHRIAYKAN